MSPGTDALVGLLAEALTALRENGIRPLVIGGIATAILAREPGDLKAQDLELYLLPDEAERAARALAAQGFSAGEAREGWFHTAQRDGVAVRLHYRQPGDLYVDEDMVARAVHADFGGVAVPLISPEDLVVLKVLLHGEDRASDWWDALALLERPDLDWDYLVNRAEQYGAQRVLSLFCYGRSLALPVPEEALRALFEFLEERRAE